jgi:hypothetical protein
LLQLAFCALVNDNALQALGSYCGRTLRSVDVRCCFPITDLGVQHLADGAGPDGSVLEQVSHK